MYPIVRKPERVTLYTRAGLAEEIFDRSRGSLVDEWA
jgi:hypothetical protein